MLGPGGGLPGKRAAQSARLVWRRCGSLAAGCCPGTQTLSCLCSELGTRMAPLSHGRGAAAEGHRDQWLLSSPSSHLGLRAEPAARQPVVLGAQQHTILPLGLPGCSRGLTAVLTSAWEASMFPLSLCPVRLRRVIAVWLVPLWPWVGFDSASLSWAAS